jgi:hypothetical protein
MGLKFHNFLKLKYVNYIKTHILISVGKTDGKCVCTQDKERNGKERECSEIELLMKDGGVGGVDVRASTTSAA